MNPLFGLVVAGGKSSRMGTDKSLINYHGLPQRYHVYNLLKPFCSQAFISCSQVQAPHIDRSYEFIPDHPSLGDIGPMAGLLSAVMLYPQASFLVIGCDYPLLSPSDIQCLAAASLESNRSVAFTSTNGQIPEPLLAVYQHDTLQYLMQSFHQGNHSLRRFLQAYNTLLLTPSDHQSLRSFDTPEDLNAFKASLPVSLTPKS